MRAIKFRGWHTGMQEMVSAEEMARDQLTLLPTGQFINVNGSSVRLSEIYPADKFIPLQYTGLRDKNGKEIYEGDLIINESLRICEVIFMSGAFDAKPVNVPIKSDSVGFKLEQWRYRIEIIGNIYEHQTLIVG